MDEIFQKPSLNAFFKKTPDKETPDANAKTSVTQEGTQASVSNEKSGEHAKDKDKASVKEKESEQPKESKEAKAGGLFKRAANTLLESSKQGTVNAFLLEGTFDTKELLSGGITSSDVASLFKKAKASLTSCTCEEGCV